MLETRAMLAGDTYLINFQNDEATAPTRYATDLGAVFGARGNGLTYGWSTSHISEARERSADADQRFDTLIHVKQGQNWEFQLPNGAYEVTVAVGDPGNNDGVHTVNIEGVSFFNAAPDGNDPQVATHQVTVADGRLTLGVGAAADRATRVNYIHIVGVPSGANASPSAPTVTEPAVDGQVVNPSDVHMEAVGYSDPEGNLHKSSDWEIWTTGPNAELVWQTLGIEGVERLHTHLGDGIFVGSRAGEISVAELTQHELRVRFRDDAGAVSAYATRLFTTAAESTVFPMELEDIADAPAPSWENAIGTPVDLPAGDSFLSPADAIIAIDLTGDSDSPGGEQVGNLIDGNAATKYLNFGEQQSGFIVTPAVGATTIASFRLTTANDAADRDPASWELYGTNDAITTPNHGVGDAEDWVLIDSGSLSLPTARNTQGPTIAVDNAAGAFTSYRMVFPTVRNAGAANSMQLAEAEFFADDTGATVPSQLRIEDGATGAELLTIEGSDLPGNTVTGFPALSAHADVRVVIVAGTGGLVLQPTDLTVADGNGTVQTIFLPAVNLAPGQRLDLWVSNSGATYFGTALQTTPSFTLLARAANLNIPFITTQPGFIVEEVGGDYRLPVNIAFVPDPGPNPTDPLYYVTELYGSIQVVTRDGEKHEFASGLLDYNPTGPISGSGEQGLTGIAVQRDPLNPEVYHLYVGMLADNGNPPGGATHYPRVERLDSTPGGLTLASRTLLLNMQPETQGQSHQISNITIGPDGKLYVHNGDGFDASTAQNLDLFRGKVLRLNLDGSAPSDNPFYNAGNGITARDYVFAYGLRNPFGGAWRASDGEHYQVENGPSVDRLAKVEEGVNYGWNGSNASMQIGAIYNWNPSHAPVGITFVQNETFGGSQFPASHRDVAFVTESGPTYAQGPQANGKRLVSFELDSNGALVSGPETLVEYVGSGRSSVVAIAAGPDGIYFSELYEDSGEEGPTASGARIYRVRYVNPLAGDYDINGVVDSNDLEVFRASFGSNLLLAADGNGDGVVDAADYTVWRDNLGASLAPAVAAVFEELEAAQPSAVAPTSLDAAPASSTFAGLSQSASATDLGLQLFAPPRREALRGAFRPIGAQPQAADVDQALLRLDADRQTHPGQGANLDLAFEVNYAAQATDGSAEEHEGDAFDAYELGLDDWWLDPTTW